MKTTNFIDYDSWIKESKHYGGHYAIKDLTPGQKVTYSGTPCEVVESGQFIAKLKMIDNPEKEFKVNQSMFNQKGFIS